MVLKCEVSDVRRVEVQDGEYDGIWSGYGVRFSTPQGAFTGRAKVGVRGLNVPCRVRVHDGMFSVSTID